MTSENEPTATATTGPAEGDAPTAPRRRRRAATRPAGPPQHEPLPATEPAAATEPVSAPTPAPAEPAAVEESAAAAGTEAAPAPAKRAPRKRAAKKTAAPEVSPDVAAESVAEAPAPPAAEEAPAPATKTARKRTSKKAAAAAAEAEAAARAVAIDSAEATSAQADEAAGPAPVEPAVDAEPEAAPAPEAAPVPEEQPEDEEAEEQGAAEPAPSGIAVLFQAPDPAQAAPPRRRRAASRPAGPPQVEEAAAPPAQPAAQDEAAEPQEQPASEGAGPDEDGEGDGGRRRRRRGGRGRRRRGSAADSGDETEDEGGAAAEQQPAAQQQRAGADGKAQGEAQDKAGDDEAEDVAEDVDEDDRSGEESSSTRRRRRRRRRGAGADADLEPGPDDPPNTVVKVRQPRKAEDDITALKGSTRLEAKRQRRREGRDAGRRRQVVTEAEFLARRESVERVMVVRERDGRTQIAVLEDGVLVEHYVARKSQASMAGNVYLGKVQNVLPSMEAAFVDIGKGRNAVLYAGEVNWDAAGLEGQPKRIELALKSGDPVLVQVTKDPVGHKGARLTSQVSLPGRYLVYVPNGSMTGISRKLPDTERNRLKKILKQVVPDEAGVIVRTAAEGASEEELARDVARLQAQWEDIRKKSGAVNPPTMLHGEPDLTIKVVRDVFNEDFTKLVVSGDEAWQTVQDYVGYVAPDLADRLERWTGDEDVFAAQRVDEQIAKALERKVWLPSGGSLVIDRTEAMTVVDVNTGKFTGSGGNLEETVTKNNLEAAEEIVRQLRLRDIGGIIVVDFIDMVLESNRDLVLRRLLECLGRDRTKHQVAEVTSLGLVQMTRKRVGQGLLEAFSEPCEACAGRGVHLHEEPVEKQPEARKPNGGNGSGKQASGDGKQQRRRGGAKDVAEAARKATAEQARSTEPVSAQDAGPATAEPAPVPAGGGAPAADEAEQAGGRYEEQQGLPVEQQPV